MIDTDKWIASARVSLDELEKEVKRLRALFDTDKYEGHAEGEWTIEMNDTGDECAIHAQDYGTIAQTFYRDSDKLFLATTRLIADAPLLLAEAERLREQNKLMVDYFRFMRDGELTDEDWRTINEWIGGEEE